MGEMDRLYLSAVCCLLFDTKQAKKEEEKEIEIPYPSKQASDLTQATYLLNKLARQSRVISHNLGTYLR